MIFLNESCAANDVLRKLRFENSNAHEGNKLAPKKEEPKTQRAMRKEAERQRPRWHKHVYFHITHSISRALQGSPRRFYSTSIF